MKPLWWMGAAAFGSSLAVATAPGVDSDREVLLGMFAPLAAAMATGVLVMRTWASRPETLTPLMVAAFGAKLVFFGGYVAVVIKVLAVRPLPFVISFTTYFIALHLGEAFWLQRFFAGHNAYVGRVPPSFDTASSGSRRNQVDRPGR